MKHIINISILSLVYLPFITYAADVPVVLDEMVVTADRINSGGGQTFQAIAADLIVRGSNYALTLLVGLTVLVFLYGLMKYMFKGQESDTARTEGRTFMLWGLIGLFVMTSIWALIAILANTIGHNKTGIPQFGFIESSEYSIVTSVIHRMQ